MDNHLELIIMMCLQQPIEHPDQLEKIYKCEVEISGKWWIMEELLEMFMVKMFLGITAVGEPPLSLLALDASAFKYRFQRVF